MKPKIPSFETDAEAEAFVETVDLAQFDLSCLRPTRFAFHAKAAQRNMRLPQPLLDAVEESATAKGMPHNRFVIETMEQTVVQCDRASGRRV